MRLQVFLLLLTPLLTLQATNWFCFCGVQYFPDPQCLFPISWGVIREYQQLCMNNTFPMGSWGVATNPNTRNIQAAVNNSYMVQSCLVPPAFIMQFFKGVVCNAETPLGPPVAMVTDEVCRGPYPIYGDWLWTKVTCGAPGLGTSLALLMALPALWIWFYSH